MGTSGAEDGPSYRGRRAAAAREDVDRTGGPSLAAAVTVATFRRSFLVEVTMAPRLLWLAFLSVFGLPAAAIDPWLGRSGEDVASGGEEDEEDPALDLQVALFGDWTVDPDDRA